MQETDLLKVKGKIITGVLALTTRSFILQLISFGSTFILTILLSPSVFGIFFVVSAIISFLSYFSDVGLAAALIQKKKEPTRSELVTTFTIQQILVGLLVVIAFLLSPYLISVYGLDQKGLFLFRALLISFFLSSLKTIPSVLLERKLEFRLLVLPQIFETLGFYLVAIFLAYLGKGISSFAWAALARGVVGLVAIYIIAPWRIGIGFSSQSIRKLISFGLPFQLNSILALVKDDLMTIFLGKILPFSQVGYIGWAKKWAEVPLRLIMDNIIKVTFPTFSRLQENKKILSKAIAKSFFFLALFILPSTVFLLLFIKPLVNFIPKYQKWQPAIISFYLFAFSSVFAAFSSPIVNALNAIGKIKTTLILMVFWTILTWILVPVFVYFLGFNGVAFSAFLISSTAFLPILIIKKYIQFSPIQSLKKPVLASLLLATVVVLIYLLKPNYVGLILAFLVGILGFLSFVWFFMREEILPYIPRFF